MVTLETRRKSVGKYIQCNFMTNIFCMEIQLVIVPEWSSDIYNLYTLFTISVNGGCLRLRYSIDIDVDKH